VPNDKYTKVATKYRVDDLAGASIPSSRLAKILKNLEMGASISNHAQDFLIKMDLLALLGYAKQEITFIEFLGVAESEQSNRRLAAEAEAQKRLAEQKLKDAERELKNEAVQAKLRQIAEAKKLRQKSVNKAEKLRGKYDLEQYIEEADFPKVMKILRKVDSGSRLSKEELVWLLGSEKYYTSELKEGYHRNEARFYATQYSKTKDYWSAINASSHYRKCGEAGTADSMLTAIDVSGLKNKKLKSALFTTHGGAKRDLEQKNEALNLGKQAHFLTPRDFRPCTLLGAVNLEIGNIELGHSWFNKAIERGYDESSMDNELRSIFMRADKSTKEALRDYLLKEDPIRYSWAKKKNSSRQSQKIKSNNKVKK
jgi:O6-methylguanine-DNA--protein-cysteine methyltransferase